ncbi:extracellular solute-binding protein [Conexibacter sp. JD483]|uniref:extracellular solute-binding protein n=1 Tax=unclassified Conexibacter TaxID=2627773 RepID=UPI00271F6AF2|nr:MULTISPECIES: extracellular solute-binding protein [unclassified Conexibacter]MDO8187657.1 extracellular solute-binding protein [Conexibacter sp. CPCC 205706]MDO8199842.1 extracellular solute-binding protein [Conexibacter sp. CPCC 205762]MDR9370219.1 extracellular solute-binding protein [Conexibacter sp. JD483]
MRKSLWKRKGGWSAVAGVAVASVALAACGSSDDAGDGGSATGKRGGKVTIATYGGKTEDVMKAVYFTPEFKARTGISMSFDAPLDYAKLQTQVESGNIQWDMTSGDPYMAIAQCGTVFAKIRSDPAMFKEKYRDVVGDCVLPRDAGSFIKAYNAKTFADDPPSSWADFFDVEKYPGKRAVPSFYYNGIIEGALLADGVAPEDLYPLDLDRAFKKMDSIRGDLLVYNTLAQSIQQQVSGDVAMGIYTDSAAWQAADAGATIEPIWDQAFIYINLWTVTEGTPNRAAVDQVINYVLNPRLQTEAAEMWPVSPALKDAKQPRYPNELFKKYSLAVPEHEEVAIPFDQQWYADNYEELNQRFTAWISG